MAKKMKSLVAILVSIVVFTSLFSGCDKFSQQFSDNTSTKGQDTSNGESSKENSDEEELNLISGDDIFDGERFDEMIWGYYEADCYEYNGYNDDAKEFLQEMEFITLNEDNEQKVSVLPLSLQAGKYSHFMSTFYYEDKFYEPYTEKGKTMFRKAYIAEVGDMTEEQFQKIEAIMQLDVIEVTMAYENGATRMDMFAYEIENNSIVLYELSIDDDYNITISDEPFVKYNFLHDGSKLTLRYHDVQRDYKANGLKETDSSLSCSGYALNAENKYKDLEGFYFSKYKEDDEVSVYIELSNGDSPLDPVMEFDSETGNFTISWEKVWTINCSEVDDPRSISGKLVPCTSYGFTDYEGFFLIIEGKCYRYLMSEQEFEERMYSDVLGDISIDDVSDSQLDKIETTKRNILEELKKAFDAAGIEAEIDTVSGKVALEANFLFATDSSQISVEGQDYLNRFIDAYTSVVLGDSYADYISNIVIEGHTDTSGSYSYNQTLSENRAKAVADHCIGRSPALESVIQTKGCSYDFPVYNDDGSVNMDKSRRVTFRFVFTDV